MKKPPIPIIICLCLLNVGYLYFGCSVLFENIYRFNITLSILFFFLTILIIGINMAALERQSKLVLFSGAMLTLLAVASTWNAKFYPDIILSSLILLAGIIFIIWGIFISKGSKQPKNIELPHNKKHKYWLYSAIVFSAIGMIFGMLGQYAYANNLYKSYGVYYSIMPYFLFAGILQFVIYYLLTETRKKPKAR